MTVFDFGRKSKGHSRREIGKDMGFGAVDVAVLVERSETHVMMTFSQRGSGHSITVAIDRVAVLVEPDLLEGLGSLVDNLHELINSALTEALKEFNDEDGA